MEKQKRALSPKETQSLRESVAEGVRTVVKPLLENVKTVPLSSLPGMKPGEEWKL